MHTYISQLTTGGTLVFSLKWHTHKTHLFTNTYTYTCINTYWSSRQEAHWCVLDEIAYI